MKIFMKILSILILLCASAFATNTVYISHAGGSVNCGTIGTITTQSYSYFSSSANWNSSPTGNQIGPGTTVHACAETYTDATANDTALTFQCGTANGTSSNPITLIFDQGAMNLNNSSYWNTSNGAIYLSGCTYAVVNGSSNLTIANQSSGGVASNGSGLANEQTSFGIVANNCTHCTVEYTTVKNIYVNNGSGSGSSDINGQYTICISFIGNSTNSLITRNTVSQCKVGIEANADANNDASNVEISYNSISDMDWGVNIGGGDPFDTMNNDLIHDNEITNWTNWAFPTSTYHQDGIILFNFGLLASNGHMTNGSAVLTSTSAPFTSAMVGQPIVVSGAGASGGELDSKILSYQSTSQVTLVDNASTTITTATVQSSTGITASLYNNHIYGDLTNGSPTGFIYCSNFSSCTVFNNLLVTTNSAAGHNQYGIMWLGASLGENYKVYNNTVISANSADVCVMMNGVYFSTYDYRNNICYAANGLTNDIESYLHDITVFAPIVTNSNYNVWSPAVSNFWGSQGSGLTASYSTWQTTYSLDANSSTTNPSLTNALIPATTSSAYHLGTNLTSLGITALNTGAPQTFGASGSCGYGCQPRAASGSWDAGAYPYEATTVVAPIGAGIIGLLSTPEEFQMQVTRRPTL
jgi:hypothetical protein